MPRSHELMSSEEEQLRTELKQIRLLVEQITGLHSRWNGHVQMESQARFRGKKSYSCHIVLRAGLVHEESRWRTLIHELLHSVSPGYNWSDYDRLTGWEEGVVEQVQRMIRPRVFEGLQISVPDSVFEHAEREHPFNYFIEALERVRLALGQSQGSFYLELLRTPLRERYGYLLRLGSTLAGRKRVGFLKVLATAGSILGR